MDSLTHLAAGALTPLAFSRAPRLGLVVVFGIVAGELPDIDILAGTSAFSMLQIHRGPTHSLPALVLFAILLALGLRARLRRISGQHQTVRLEGGRPVICRPDDWPLWQIFLAALLALVLHVYLDSMTTFGTRVLWPFSDLRLALPALFIVDPLFTLPLLAALLGCLVQLRRRKRALSSGSLERLADGTPSQPDKSIIWARRALLWVVFYPLLCLGLNQLATWKVSQTALLPETGAATGFERLHLTTTPLSPFRWKVVAESGGEYRLGIISLPGALLGSQPELGRAYPRAAADPAIPWRELSEKLPIFNSYTSFASYPVVRESRYEVQSEIREITFEDLRYTPSGPEDLSSLYDRVGSMFLMQVRLDKSGRHLLAWRYLTAFDEAESANWVTLEEPLKLY